MYAVYVAFKALFYVIIAPFVGLPNALLHGSWGARAYLVAAALLGAAIWYTGWKINEPELAIILGIILAAVNYLWMEVFGGMIDLSGTKANWD